MGTCRLLDLGSNPGRLDPLNRGRRQFSLNDAGENGDGGAVFRESRAVFHLPKIPFFPCDPSIHAGGFSVLNSTHVDLCPLGRTMYQEGLRGPTCSQHGSSHTGNGRDYSERFQSLAASPCCQDESLSADRHGSQRRGSSRQLGVEGISAFLLRIG